MAQTTSNETRTVVGVFELFEHAQTAVRNLEAAGFSRDDISVVANQNVTASLAGENLAEETGVRARTAADAGIGAFIGGVGGLLVGFAALAVPGVGPIMAAGPILAGLSGAGLGAVAGGLIGSLTASGIPEEEAQYYAEGVRRGDVLVTVHTDPARAEQVREILDDAGAIDIEARVKSWRERGWAGHLPGAEPLSADEIRREREFYVKPVAVVTETAGDQNPVGGGLEGSQWPHREAYPIGASIPQPSTPFNPPSESYERDMLESGSVLGESVRPLRSDSESPSNFSDAIENNRRRPDPAVVHAERGFERAMESASRSARRMARIYLARHNQGKS